MLQHVVGTQRVERPGAERQPVERAADLDVRQREQVDVQVVVGVRLLPGTDLQPHAGGGVSFLITFAGRPATTA